MKQVPFGSAYDRSKYNSEMLDGMPPVLQFNYVFKHPFLTMAQASVNKYNWETRHTTTTHENIEQVDDDKVVFWRRVTNYQTKDPVWEKVTIDRAAKTVTGEHLGFNNDGSTFCTARSVMSSDDSSKSNYVAELWDVQGNGSSKVEAFKTQCLKLIKAVQFQHWTSQ